MTSNEKIKISLSVTHRTTAILGYDTGCKPAARVIQYLLKINFKTIASKEIYILPYYTLF